MIDRYAQGNALCNVKPEIKVIFSLIMMLSVFFIPKPFYMAGVFLLMVCMTLFGAKIPRKIFMHTLIFDSVFIIPGALALLFTIGKGGNDYLWSFPLFSFTVGITQVSIETAILVFCRAMSAVSCTLFLIYSTPVIQVAGVMRRAHFNSVFLEIFVLTYRFIFDFWDRVKQMYQAQELRFGYRNLSTTVKSLAMIVSNLFFMAMESYEEMTKSLQLKQYDGDFHIEKMSVR